MKTVGDRIKNLRKELGISQTDFANRIGVSKQTLYKYENGIITNIPSDKIEAIATKFNISPARLMGWDSAEDTNATTTTEITLHLTPLSEEESEIMAMYRALNKRGRDVLRIQLQMMNKESIYI